MSEIVFNNGSRISLEDSPEKVIKNILEKHPKAPSDIKYVSSISIDIKAINYILENGSKDDFDSFFVSITENSRDISLRELSKLLSDIKRVELKKRFLEFLDDFIFLSTNIPQSHHFLIEERCRHILIFAMAEYFDHKELINKWKNIETFFEKMGKKTESKFSIKSEMFWKLRANENELFYKSVFENAGEMLAQSSKNKESIAPFAEDILFSFYDFVNKEKNKKYLEDVESLKIKYECVDLFENKYSIADCTANNRELSANDFINYILTYREKNIHNLFDSKDLFSSALRGFILNKSKKGSLNNEFFINLIDSIKKENSIEIQDGFKFTRLLSTWLNHIENANTIILIKENIDEYNKCNIIYPITFNDVLSLGGYSFNTMLKTPPSESEIYKMLLLLKENDLNLNKIFDPSILGEQMGRVQAKEAIKYIEGYLPTFIKFFLDNKIDLSNEIAKKITESLQSENKPDNFLLNKSIDNIKEIIKKSDLNLEQIKYLYNNKNFKKINFMHEIVSEKEKEVLLKISNQEKDPSPFSKRRL